MKNNSLSVAARKRLSWMKSFESSGNARKTCREFGISPSTFYHWKNKFDPNNPASMEDTASRKPLTPRKSKWDFKTLILIERFLEYNPKSGNTTIQSFLKKQNVQLSASTISRIMKQYRAARSIKK